MEAMIWPEMYGSGRIAGMMMTKILKAFAAAHGSIILPIVVALRAASACQAVRATISGFVAPGRT